MKDAFLSEFRIIVIRQPEDFSGQLTVHCHLGTVTKYEVRGIVKPSRRTVELTEIHSDRLTVNNDAP